MLFCGEVSFERFGAKFAMNLGPSGIFGGVEFELLFWFVLLFVSSRFSVFLVFRFF